MLRDYLDFVINGEDLSRQQAQQAMGCIMTGQASEAQIGAFLTALRMKGATSTEITGFADTMRQHAIKISVTSHDIDTQPLIDTCGTGGDCKGTFNVSTTVAFVLAGAGLTIAKHGNRGISSSSGSADVLNALGVCVELSPEQISTVISKVGIGFLYAPLFHQAMKYAAKPRKELGFRTVFNVLGPLTNPAHASKQLVGVYERKLTGIIAEALLGLGVDHAMVVHSLDGMDEISTAAPTQVVEVKNGELLAYVIDPQEYGFTYCDFNAYRGGSPEDNAKMLLAVLQGETGPKRDIVLINAAAALVVGDKAADLYEGLSIAAKSIDSGAALAKLQGLCQTTQQLTREGLLLS